MIELTVACGDGAVRLVEVQRAGGKPLTAHEFLRGAKLAKGARCDRRCRSRRTAGSHAALPPRHRI